MKWRLEEERTESKKGGEEWDGYEGMVDRDTRGESAVAGGLITIRGNVAHMRMQSLKRIDISLRAELAFSHRQLSAAPSSSLPRVTNFTLTSCSTK